MIPAIIGAVAALGTAAANAYSSSQDRKAASNLAAQKARRVSTASQKADATYQDIEKQLQDYYDNITKYSDDDMVQQYKDLVSGYNPEEYAYDFDEFNYGKSVDDYMTPYMDEIINNAMNKVQSTAAGAGLGRSAGTAQEMLDVSAEKQNELRKEALAEYQTDRDFAYKQYSDYITNMQNKLNTMANLTTNQINILGGAIQKDEQNQSDYMSDLLAIAQDKAQNQINAAAWS